ncbi:MAG: polysaccharide pyruvyl transferase family protein, partial [Candidatus Heimdallarchaeota archaeon]|nr:polysaccharide pyruvyl transferase family protein [Candidatus Heimdallarchaeota archaeon]
MYILLTGGKKNIGDYLIGERTRKLLMHERPDRQIVEMYPWGPLDEKKDQINNSKAVIIHGGPGYQPNMYPGIYPLLKDLREIKVPIIPMSLGWKGIPGDDLSLRSYRFNDTSMELLKKIHDSCEFSS